MYEIFHVISGEGEIIVDGKTNSLKKDQCMIINPGEWHMIKNLDDNELVLRYFGILAD